MKNTGKEHHSFREWIGIAGYALAELLRKLLPLLRKGICGLFGLLDLCLSFLWYGLIRAVCLVSPAAAEKLNGLGRVWDKLPVKVSKSAVLLAAAALVMAAASFGGAAPEGGSGSGSNVWSRDRDTFSPSFLNDCVFCTDGKETCTACDGKRGKYVYGSTPNYSGSTSGNTSHQTWQSCSKCSGTGRQSCSHCGGDGKR